MSARYRNHMCNEDGKIIEDNCICCHHRNSPNAKNTIMNSCLLWDAVIKDGTVIFIGMLFVPYLTIQFASFFSPFSLSRVLFTFQYNI